MQHVWLKRMIAGALLTANMQELHYCFIAVTSPWTCLLHVVQHPVASQVQGCHNIMTYFPGHEALKLTPINIYWYIASYELYNTESRNILPTSHIIYYIKKTCSQVMFMVSTKHGLTLNTEYMWMLIL